MIYSNSEPQRGGAIHPLLLHGALSLQSYQWSITRIYSLQNRLFRLFILLKTLVQEKPQIVKWSKSIFRLFLCIRPLSSEARLVSCMRIFHLTATVRPTVTARNARSPLRQLCLFLWTTQRWYFFLNAFSSYLTAMAFVWPTAKVDIL